MSKKRLLRVGLTVGLVGGVVFAATVGGGSAAPKSAKATDVTAALISDVGRFNDKSFNQSQLAGLLRAKKVLGVKAIPLQSNSSADYIPNLTTAVRRGADIIVCAGFLMATDCAKIARRFKDRQFAITDYSVSVPPFKKDKNITGLTYAANESGCLVGYLAGLVTKRLGGKQVIGWVGGIKIPPVDIWGAGYEFCAKLANKGIKVNRGYSQDFVVADKCKTVAENLIAQGAQVLFQVAGQCGLGTLKAADEAKIWGIGVDVDQFHLAKRVLTSGVKRVDVGVYSVIKAVVDGKPLGGSDLNFNLKNGGMGVGKISSSVKASEIAKMNAIKKRIIAGTLKVPTTL